jgi:hypothetical protein
MVWYTQALLVLTGPEMVAVGTQRDLSYVLETRLARHVFRL